MEVLKKWFTLKNILINIAEFILVVLALLTFSGEEFIGFNLPIYIFLIALSLYLIYPIYKLVLKVFNLFGKGRNS